MFLCGTSAGPHVLDIFATLLVKGQQRLDQLVRAVLAHRDTPQSQPDLELAAIGAVVSSGRSER